MRHLAPANCGNCHRASGSMTHRPVSLVAGALLLTTACSSTPDDPDPDEGHIDALHVRLVDYLKDEAPIPNAPCAFVKPGGERVEATTDSMGRLVVSDLDWSLGKLSVVCLTTDAYALVELGEDDIFDGYILMYATVESPAEKNTIQVSGTVANRASADSRIVVQSSHGVGRSDLIGNSFELPVRKNEMFDLFAYERGKFTPGARKSSRELFGWALLEHVSAALSDVTVDIDFASKPELVTSNGHLELPSNQDSVFYGASAWGDAVVRYRDDLDTVVGLALSTDHTGTTFDCQVQSLGLLASPDDVYTQYSIFADTSDASARTSVLLDGLPKNSPGIQFLDAPTMIDPTEGAPYVGSMIEWSAGGEPATSIHVCDTDNHCLYVSWPDGVTAAHLPELPGELWNAGEDVGVYLLAQDGRTDDNQYFRRYSYASVVKLTQ